MNVATKQQARRAACALSRSLARCRRWRRRHINDECDRARGRAGEVQSRSSPAARSARPTPTVSVLQRPKSPGRARARLWGTPQARSPEGASTCELGHHQRRWRDSAGARNPSGCCAPRDLTCGSVRDCSLLRVAERRRADGANPPEAQLAVSRDLPLGREGSNPSKRKRPVVFQTGRCFEILRRGRDSNPR